MSHTTINEPLIILVLAAVIFVSMLGRGLARRIGIPGMVAFLLIGIGINVGYLFAGGLPESLRVIVDILAKLGVITLLFEAGMHTNVQKLAQHLRRVITTWTGNVIVAGAWDTQSLTTCSGWLLFRRSSSEWHSPRRVLAFRLRSEKSAVSKTQNRDVCSWVSPGLDDISAVVLMAILFDVAPILRGTAEGALGPMIVERLLLTLAKLGGFGALCLLFSRYVEHRLRAALQRLESPAASLLSVIAISIIIAAFDD